MYDAMSNDGGNGALVILRFDLKGNRRFWMGYPTTDVFHRTVHTCVEKPANLGDIYKRFSTFLLPTLPVSIKKSRDPLHKIWHPPAFSLQLSKVIAFKNYVFIKRKKKTCLPLHCLLTITNQTNIFK